MSNKTLPSPFSLLPFLPCSVGLCTTAYHFPVICRGADLHNQAPRVASDVRRHWLQQLVTANLYLTHALATHSKILVAALNGPAVGGAAALVAFADFVYAAPSTYLLYPFASLGLVAEVGVSRTVVQRLGISLANEALLMGRKIGVDQLLKRGFVKKIIESDKVGTEGKEGSRFLDLVLDELEGSLGDHLHNEGLLGIKALIQRPEQDVLERQNVAEVFAGVERLASGVMDEELQRIPRGEKRYKL